MFCGLFANLLMSLHTLQLEPVWAGGRHPVLLSPTSFLRALYCLLPAFGHPGVKPWPPLSCDGTQDSGPASYPGPSASCSSMAWLPLRKFPCASSTFPTDNSAGGTQNSFSSLPSLLSLRSSVLDIGPWALRTLGQHFHFELRPQLS